MVNIESVTHSIDCLELKCGMNQVGAETHLIYVDELNGIAHRELDCVYVKWK